MNGDFFLAQPEPDRATDPSPSFTSNRLVMFKRRRRECGVSVEKRGKLRALKIALCPTRYKELTPTVKLAGRRVQKWVCVVSCECKGLRKEALSFWVIAGKRKLARSKQPTSLESGQGEAQHFKW